MIYLSGCVVSFRHPMLGFLMAPDRKVNDVPEAVPVAVDNSCFANPADYSDERYSALLRRMPADRTLFATAPDVLGDHDATVARSLPVLRHIRALGLPPAFVAQDGWEDATTPWDEFDALFVGGSTDFKFRGGRAAVHAARRRGKWAHMGRVNSLRRLRAAAAIGCNSADGNFLKFAPDQNVLRMRRWLDAMQAQPEMMMEVQDAD